MRATTGADDELAYAVRRRRAGGVARREALVVVVMTGDEQRHVVVDEALPDRLETRRVGDVGPARLVAEGHRAGRGMRGEVVGEPLVLR